MEKQANSHILRRRMSFFKNKNCPALRTNCVPKTHRQPFQNPFGRLWLWRQTCDDVNLAHSRRRYSAHHGIDVMVKLRQNRKSYCGVLLPVKSKTNEEAQLNWEGIPGVWPLLPSMCFWYPRHVNEMDSPALLEYLTSGFFSRCFRDPNRVPSIENRVPRIREIGSLQVHTGYLTFSLKKPALPNQRSDQHARDWRRRIELGWKRDTDTKHHQLAAGFATSREWTGLGRSGQGGPVTRNDRTLSFVPRTRHRHGASLWTERASTMTIKLAKTNNGESAENNGRARLKGCARG